MKFSTICRNGFSILFVLFIILAAFVIPAAAADSLTSNLDPLSLGIENLAPNQTKKIAYKMDVALSSHTGSSGEDLPYAFNITLSNPSNLILKEDSLGVRFDESEFILNSTKAPIIGTNNIVYYFDAVPASGLISFQLEIDGKQVYPNETATITATFSQLDEYDVPTLILTQTDDIIIDYSLSSTNLVSSVDFALVKPLLLPVGSSTPGEPVYVLAESFLRYTENMSGPNSDYYFYSYELDFSNVLITVGSTTQTYSTWLATSAPGQAPVYFVSNNGYSASDLTGLSGANLTEFNLGSASPTVTLLSSSSYNSVSPSYKYNSTNQSFPFMIIINDAFVKIGGIDPSINLDGVEVNVELNVNNIPGAVEVLGFYSWGGVRPLVFSPLKVLMA
jgi:hypothetical protein